ncbi:MAG: maleylpyruvate isomerase family mycothiol-dependent enzyme [Acidimicrobiia bacterium]
MDKKDYLEAVATNSEQFAAAVRRAGYDTRVPTCPEWSVTNLVEHFSGVHRWVTMLFELRAQSMPNRDEVPHPPEGTDWLDWFEAGVAPLLAHLEQAGPDLSIWNWQVGGPADSSYWPRRMAHEAVIHRADAEAAAGVASVVEPPDLAADGIDEFLGFVELRRRHDPESVSVEGTFHFHTTDTEGEWLVEITPEAVSVRREHAKAPVAVRGPAGALELFLYNRGPADGLEILGEAALMDAWGEHVRF